MGAGASAVNPTLPLSLDKLKELAGDKWSDELEARYEAEWAKNENLCYNDIKVLMPRLCLEPTDSVDLDTLKEMTLKGGCVEWNEQLQGLFDEHKNISEDGKESIDFGTWMRLVPILFETKEEREARVAVEYAAKLAERAEGNIVVNYQMYNEEFPISKNSITAGRIDEDYALTDVMPGCRIRLSALEPKRRTEYANKYGRDAPFIKEEPEGAFIELMAGETYYCIVIEDPVQYKKDMDALAKSMEGVSKDTEQKERQEGCSCLYGNPCQDPYVCLDWDNRWAVAIKNGMTKQEIQRAGIIP